MKKFVFIYYDKLDFKNLDEAVKKEFMDRWMIWFDSFKDKMVDGGNPFGDDGQSVTAANAEAISQDMWPAKGYTIINAGDMAEAVDIAKGCPALVDDPEGSIRVYEALPM